MTDKNGTAILTLPEAAKYLRVRRGDVERLIKAKRLPSVDVNGKPRIRQADLINFCKPSQVKGEVDLGEIRRKTEETRAKLELKKLEIELADANGTLMAPEKIKQAWAEIEVARDKVERAGASAKGQKAEAVRLMAEANEQIRNAVRAGESNEAQERELDRKHAVNERLLAKATGERKAAEKAKEQEEHVKRCNRDTTRELIAKRNEMVRHAKGGDKKWLEELQI